MRRIECHVNLQAAPVLGTQVKRYVPAPQRRKAAAAAATAAAAAEASVEAAAATSSGL